MTRLISVSAAIGFIWMAVYLSGVGKTAAQSFLLSIPFGLLATIFLIVSVGKFR